MHDIKWIREHKEEFDRGLARRLYRVQARTLIVHGDQDAFVPVQYADDFVRALSRAEKQVLKGAAHMLPQEQTSEVFELIEAFLEPRR